MGYYQLAGVIENLPDRLQALREVIPPHSTLLDLGCNDGCIGRALQESGHASRVVGVDLERAPDYQGQEFLARDLRQGELGDLPDADIVLFLNVAHHLLLQGPNFVGQLLERLLERWPVVLLDMGSISEQAAHPWRNLMGRLWPSDLHMWNDLFAAALWRRPLLSYPFQGGRRVLWKLVGRREEPYQYEVLGSWKRNEANDPFKKRFFSEDAPEGYEGVVFRKLRRRQTQELFWAKEPRLWRAEPSRLGFEDEVEKVVRGLPVLASLSLQRHPEWGRIYPYHQEIHEGLVFHYCTRRRFLSPSECRQAERVAQACAREGPLANIPLGLLTDFQCVSTFFGLIFLDWEPDHQQPAVEAILSRGEAARREVQELLYDPLARGALLERALDGAVFPSPELTPQEAHRLATDLWLRAYRLGRGNALGWAAANVWAAVRLGPAALEAWLNLLKKAARERLRRGGFSPVRQNIRNTK